MATPTRYFESALAFLEALPAWAPEGRRGRMGFTNGCFDILHPGHVAYLEEVRELCDFLVVGLNSDASVARLKGPARPVQDEAARATILLGLRSVDAVVRFAEDTPQLLIQDLQPDLLAKGGDYTPSTVVGRDIVEARGGRLVLLPFREGNSTSRVVTRIKSGRGVTLD